MASIDGQDLVAERMFSPATDHGNSASPLRWATRALVGTFWISAAIFGLYIISFYAGAVFDGTPERWNESLPGIYEPHTLFATIGIAAHFATGGVLLLFGPIQLIASVRESMPQLHRWLGRIYGSTALITGLGGLVFIALNGTIGGAPMNVGFGLYGALMVVAALQAIRHARARRFDEHRGLGNPPIRARDRLVAIPDGLRILANCGERNRPHSEFRRAVRHGDVLLLLYSQPARRRGVHSHTTNAYTPGDEVNRGAPRECHNYLRRGRHLLFHRLPLGAANLGANYRGSV